MGAQEWKWKDRTSDTSVLEPLHTHIPREKFLSPQGATKSTLAFHDAQGHSYRVGFKGASSVERCFNDKLNEKPENIYSHYYPTVAKRVAVEKIELEVPVGAEVHDLEIEPLDPGIVFEKVVVDFGGYQESYLMGNESTHSRK